MTGYTFTTLCGTFYFPCQTKRLIISDQKETGKVEQTKLPKLWNSSDGDWGLELHPLAWEYNKWATAPSRPVKPSKQNTDKSEQIQAGKA